MPTRTSTRSTTTTTARRRTARSSRTQPRRYIIDDESSSSSSSSEEEQEDVVESKENGSSRHKRTVDNDDDDESSDNNSSDDDVPLKSRKTSQQTKSSTKTKKKTKSTTSKGKSVGGVLATLNNQLPRSTKKKPMSASARNARNRRTNTSLAGLSSVSPNTTGRRSQDREEDDNDINPPFELEDSDEEENVAKRVVSKKSMQTRIVTQKVVTTPPDVKEAIETPKAAKKSSMEATTTSSTMMTPPPTSVIIKHQSKTTHNDMSPPTSENRTKYHGGRRRIQQQKKTNPRQTKKKLQSQIEDEVSAMTGENYQDEEESFFESDDNDESSSTSSVASEHSPCVKTPNKENDSDDDEDDDESSSSLSEQASMESSVVDHEEGENDDNDDNGEENDEDEDNQEEEDELPIDEESIDDEDDEDEDESDEEFEFEMEDEEFVPDEEDYNEDDSDGSLGDFIVEETPRKSARLSARKAKKKDNNKKSLNSRPIESPKQQSKTENDKSTDIQPEESLKTNQPPIEDCSPIPEELEGTMDADNMLDDLLHDSPIEGCSPILGKTSPQSNTSGNSKPEVDVEEPIGKIDEANTAFGGSNEFVDPSSFTPEASLPPAESDETIIEETPMKNSLPRRALNFLSPEPEVEVLVVDDDDGDDTMEVDCVAVVVDDDDDDGCVENQNSEDKNDGNDEDFGCDMTDISKEEKKSFSNQDQSFCSISRDADNHSPNEEVLPVAQSEETTLEDHDRKDETKPHHQEPVVAEESGVSVQAEVDSTKEEHVQNLPAPRLTDTANSVKTRPNTETNQTSDHGMMDSTAENKTETECTDELRERWLDLQVATPQSQSSQEGIAADSNPRSDDILVPSQPADNPISAKKNSKETEVCKRVSVVQKKIDRSYRAEGSVKRGQWTLGAKIGVGSFGEVFVGMNTKTGTLMAVKRFHMEGAEKDDIQREIELLRSLEHANIVRYLGAEMDKKTLHIFQEWVPGGSVSSLLNKFGSFSLEVIQSYLSQTLAGLAYLHENNIMHRDIKGSNILVNDYGIVKLADFGASKKLANLEDNMMMSMTVRGSPYFMAPEVFEERYSAKADVWSVGGVAFQMATAMAPWKEKGFTNPISLFNYIKRQTGPPRMEHPGMTTFSSRQKNMWHALEELVRKCFLQNPEERPTVKQVQAEPFFLSIHDDGDEDEAQCLGLFSPRNGGLAFGSPGSPKLMKSPKFDKPISSKKKAKKKATPSASSPLKTGPIARSKSVVQWKTTFASPPRQKRVNERKSPSTIPKSPAKMLSPTPNSSDWPEWAKNELKKQQQQQQQLPMQTPHKEMNDLQTLMDSLALSESTNVFAAQKTGTATTCTTSSVKSSLYGLALLEEEEEKNEENQSKEETFEI